MDVRHKRGVPPGCSASAVAFGVTATGGAARFTFRGKASSSLRYVRAVNSAANADAVVTAVSRSAEHSFSKQNVASIRLIKGLGVEGDAHMGRTVQHRSRVAADPSQPNLRQVHLIHEELFGELATQGFVVSPGNIGENITTRGVDLLGLPTGTWLRIGGSAIVALSGLRNPCAQLDHLQPGLLSAVLGRDAEGRLVRKAGVMAVVVEGGDVAAGAAITVQLPPLPHSPLERV